MRRRLALWLIPFGLSAAVPSGAEIVVLDDGRFLQASRYQLDGDRMRIELEVGGELTLPLLRIARIVEDEVSDPAAINGMLEPLPLDLGFSEAAGVPEVPFGQYIFEFSRAVNINPALVVAVVRAESAFDPGAVSSKGARGLMQLMPATGKRLGVVPAELFDPEINLHAGVTYLGQLIDRYADDLPLVLAAYNAGEGAVDRHNGVPPYKETQDYIRRIYSFLGISEAAEESSGS